MPKLAKLKVKKAKAPRPDAMAVSEGLHAIASAISDLAEAVREHSLFIDTEKKEVGYVPTER